MSACSETPDRGCRRRWIIHRFQDHKPTDAIPISAQSLVSTPVANMAELLDKTLQIASVPEDQMWARLAREWCLAPLVVADYWPFTGHRRRARSEHPAGVSIISARRPVFVISQGLRELFRRRRARAARDKSGELNEKRNRQAHHTRDAGSDHDIRRRVCNGPYHQRQRILVL